MLYWIQSYHCELLWQHQQQHFWDSSHCCVHENLITWYIVGRSRCHNRLMHIIPLCTLHMPAICWSRLGGFPQYSRKANGSLPPHEVIHPCRKQQWNLCCLTKRLLIKVKNTWNKMIWQARWMYVILVANCCKTSWSVFTSNTGMATCSRHPIIDNVASAILQLSLRFTGWSTAYWYLDCKHSKRAVL